MAFRNIFRQKRRSILTTLTMFGGFVLTMVAVGMTDGNFNGMIDMFTRNSMGHIQVHARGYLDRPSLHKVIPDYPAAGDKIGRVEGVEAWAPRVFSAGLASVGEKTAAAVLTGIDPVLETRATRFDKKIYEGRPPAAAPAKEAAIGRGLAKTLKAKLDDDLVFVTQGFDGSLANEKYRLVGFVDSGNEAADRNSFFLHIADAQELLVLEGRAHEIAVVVPKLNLVSGMTDSIEAALSDPRLSVEPWQEFARGFYTAMQAENKEHQVSLLVIFVIVAIGVLNTTLMSVLERRREHGLLKALGTRPGRLFRMIMSEVLLMAFGSIAVGSALGTAVNLYLSRHGFKLSQAFTFGGMVLDTLRVEISARCYIIPTVLVLASALIVAVYPALKAARTDPARSIRFS
jgi:ABC-type lipoprotein release transport system permease subunit